jgi:putative Mn2+ efflux pump MntP
MDVLTVFAIAMALAMDAFAVAVATGVHLRTVDLRQTFRLSWHFGLFQALMPIVGWTLGVSVRVFVEQWVHWIAFALLLYIGSRMLRESFHHQEAAMRRDPTRGMSLVMLSVATSIDAMAVGLSLSLIGVSVWQPSLIIGVVCLVVTAVGLHLGRAFTRYAAFSRYAEAAGGIVLILIGVDIVRRAGVFA